MPWQRAHCRRLDALVVERLSCINAFVPFEQYTRVYSCTPAETFSSKYKFHCVTFHNIHKSVKASTDNAITLMHRLQCAFLSPSNKINNNITVDYAVHFTHYSLRAVDEWMAKSQ